MARYGGRYLRVINRYDVYLMEMHNNVSLFVNHQVAQVVHTGDISDETLTTHSLTHGYNP